MSALVILLTLTCRARAGEGPAGGARCGWLVLGLALGAVHGCAAPEPRPPAIWHQHYESVEQAEVQAFVRDALAEAQRLYGPAARPVRSVHVRRSVQRRHPARLARADITDWVRFARALQAGRGRPPFGDLWAALDDRSRAALERASVRGTRPAFADQVAVVAALNRVLRSGALASSEAEETARRAGPDRDPEAQAALERRGRQRLARLLPHSVLPAPDRRVRLREGFELCETVDPARGVYALYVQSPPEVPAFWLELAHETAHLLNPRIRDWHMEGLCSVFAEHMARRTGRTWGPWGRRFAARRTRDPYAVSYELMKAVDRSAGDRMRTLLQYTAPGPRGRLRLDMEAWCETLDPPQYLDVLRALRRWGPVLERCGGRSNAFVWPEDLR